MNMNMKMKVVLPVIGAAACSLVWLCLFSFFSGAQAPPQAPVISVVKSEDFPAYNSAIDGFVEFLGENKIIPRLNIYMQDDENVIPKIKTQQPAPALILTLGSSTTKLVSRSITGIAIVFSVILDPWGGSIASRNIVGASVDIPVKLQMEYLRLALPNLKRIGVIYNPSENERIITEARQAAKDLGYILKTYPVSSPREIPRIEDLGIDILWVIPDNTVSRQRAIITHILLSSVKEGIPVMGFSRSWAKGGALLALSCDYKDVGRQSGEIALRILKGENYANVPISKPRIVRLYLNQIVANRLGIKFSKEILNKAEEVFEK